MAAASEGMSASRADGGGIDVQVGQSASDPGQRRHRAWPRMLSCRLRFPFFLCNSWEKGRRRILTYLDFLDAATRSSSGPLA